LIADALTPGVQFYVDGIALNIFLSTTVDPGVSSLILAKVVTG
jgi:hypothetical protein